MNEDTLRQMLRGFFEKNAGRCFSLWEMGDPGPRCAETFSKGIAPAMGEKARRLVIYEEFARNHNVSATINAQWLSHLREGGIL